MEELAGLTLAELAADEALREIGAFGSSAAAITTGAYSMLRKRKRGPQTRNEKMARRRLFSTEPTAEPARLQTGFARSRYRYGLGRRGNFMKWRSSKTTLTPSSYIGDRVIQDFRLINIPWSDDDTVYNRRTSKNVYVKGVKFRKIIRIRDDLVDPNLQERPLTVRWAILNPRSNDGSANISETNFFIDPDKADADGYTDFPASGSYFDYVNRKINLEQHGILQQGKFTINPNTSGTERQGYTQQVIMNKWIPINRVMQFDNNDAVAGSEYPTTNLYFCWWYVDHGDTEVGKRYTTTASAPITSRTELVCYFRNKSA